MIEFMKLIKTTLGTAKRVVLAQVRGVTSDENDNDASDPHDGVEIVHPVGFASRPIITSKTEALTVEHGDTVVAIAILDKSLAVHTLEEGETQLYSTKEPTCTIRLRANGDLEIVPKSGQKVYVGAANGTGGMEPVGLGTSIKSQLDAIRTAYNTHTHTGVQTGAGTSGTTAALISATPDVEADNVVVK